MCVCVCVGVSVYMEEYNNSIQEKLPLIIGSAGAAVVFLRAGVAIIRGGYRSGCPAP